MMEETEDQPEMVSHEEAVEAEKEAHERLSQSSRESTPLRDQPAAVMSAPSPLPEFLSNSPSVLPKLPTSQPLPSPPNVSTSPSGVASPAPAAPVTQRIPHMTQSESACDSAATASASNKTSGGASGHSLFGWLAGNSLVNKVVEKTKSSMESMITTLDPGMKEIINSGGDINVTVASTKDNKVVPVREAFQKVFGRATVNGQASQASTAAQPVGFTAGLKGAEERISNLKKGGEISSDQTLVAVEGFIVEILPDKWVELSCLLLKDPKHSIEVEVFSQPTSIPTEYVLAAHDMTPSDYPLRWAGLAVTIGEVIEKKEPHIGHADWQMVVAGVSRRESLRLAAISLASIYKQKLPTSFVS